MARSVRRCLPSAQPVTVCHQLTAFLGKPLFQLVPVFSGPLKIRLRREDLDDVHDGEEPSLGLLVVGAADFVSFKNGEVFFHNGALNFRQLLFANDWSISEFSWLHFVTDSGNQ